MASHLLPRSSLVLLFAGGLTAAAMAQQQSPNFEVASVKRNVSGRPAWNQNVQPGGRLVMTATTLTKIIQFAYGIQEVQLVGGPEWVRGDRFDINAKAEFEVPDAEIRLMVRSLLVDRFRLVVRKEQREMPIHEVVMNRADGRLGPNIVQVSSDEDCQAAATRLTAAPGYQKPPPGASAIRGQACGPAPSVFADLAYPYVKTAVVDKTGLTGKWLLLPYFAPDQTVGTGYRGQAPVDANLPSFFTAWQEQLGLRLRATRGIVDVLAIESVQHPTEN